MVSMQFIIACSIRIVCSWCAAGCCKLISNRNLFPVTSFHCITSNSKSFCSIGFFCPLNQLICSFCISGAAGSLLNFISKRPLNNRWCILVTFHDCFYIIFSPCHTCFFSQNGIIFFNSFFKPYRIIIAVSILCTMPSIKYFFNY